MADGLTAHPREPDGAVPVHCGFVVMRTPYLAIDDLLGLSCGLEASSATGPALDGALARDRARARDRLAALCARDDVREALFVASPSLEARLDDDPANARGQKVQRSVLRYVSRMATRPTPFGLFAGWSTGRVLDEPGARTRLGRGKRERCRRHTRLDAGYVGALVDALARDPELRDVLRYSPNSSLYEAGGRYRYVQVRRRGGRRTHHLVAIEPDVHVQVALRQAAGGASRDELAAAIRAVDVEVPAVEALAFVDELIAEQLLVCELLPAVSGADAVDALLGRLIELAGVPVAARSARVLSTVRDELAALDRDGIGAPSARYRSIASTLAELPVPLDLARVVQIDLLTPASAVLSADVAAELARAAQLLARVGGAVADERLGGFCEAFRRRYGHREDVPLCEALDEDAGIGFPVGGPGAAAPPLLEGLVFAAAHEPERPRPNARDELLLGWLGDALRTRAGSIDLDAGRLDALADAGAALPLPDAFAVRACILAADEQAIAEGRYRVHVSGVGGPSGGTLLGRFCASDATLRDAVTAHLRAEEALRPTAVFAEIAHVPEDRIANVVGRPRLRTYEIPFLAGSHAPRRHRIAVSDLRVSVVESRIVLRSARLGCEVVPRLSAAHNFDGPGNLGMYRLLCALQGQGVASAIAFSWGALERARHLPRVTAGRLVLARARWTLTAQELGAVGAARDGERFRAMRALRDRLGLPRWVAIAEADQLLPLDLENVACVDMAAELLKRRSGATLVEAFLGSDDVVARGAEGRYAHELIVPFVRAVAPATPRACARAPQSARRRVAPGSEWLYLKLYTGTAGADTVLARLVRAATADALRDGAARGWFFVRHGDPDWHLRLRLHGDPTRLLSEVLPALLDAADGLVAEGVVWRVQLDTYEREVERYGGAAGMRLSEQLFHIDSEAALEVLELVAGDAGADARWRATLVGIDRLLVDLGLDVAARRALVQRARTRLGRQLGVDAALRRALRERWRRERRAVEALLDGSDIGMRSALRPYAARSAALCPIVAELRASARAGRLTTTLDVLADSYAHMHANRMLGSATRGQELVLYDLLAQCYASGEARRAALPAVRSTSPSEP